MGVDSLFVVVECRTNADRYSQAYREAESTRAALSDG